MSKKKIATMNSLSKGSTERKSVMNINRVQAFDKKHEKSSEKKRGKMTSSTARTISVTTKKRGD